MKSNKYQPISPSFDKIDTFKTSNIMRISNLETFSTILFCTWCNRSEDNLWSSMGGLKGPERWIFDQVKEHISRFQKEPHKLSTHLQLARVKERSLIAGELHDTVGQALSALKIDLYSLEKDGEPKT